MSKEKEKFIVLWHVSPKSNRAIIESSGLRNDRRPSGFGKRPTQKAVYLFHPKNVGLVFDYIDTMRMIKSVDIWEVRVPVTDDNLDLLIADEDAVKYRKVNPVDWIASIEEFGTCAYKKCIPSSWIYHYGEISPNCNYIPFKEEEIYTGGD